MEWPEAPELPFVVEPDADALLLQLGAELQVGDFREIAEADYGNDAKEHLAGLQRILNGDMPRPLRWHPAEVLELTRWSEPDRGADAYSFDAAHRRRAFCCAALLRSLGNEIDDPPGCQQEGPNQTLIQLVASLRVLGSLHDAGAAAFLQWLIPRLPPGEEDEAPFLGLALLWFVLPRASGVPGARLVALADWIMAAEDAVSGRWRASAGAAATRPWLLSTTLFDMRHDVWRDFAGWLEVRAASRPALRETVALMAAAMRETPSEW